MAGDPTTCSGGSPERQSPGHTTALGCEAAGQAHTTEELAGQTAQKQDNSARDYTSGRRSNQLLSEQLQTCPTIS